MLMLMPPVLHAAYAADTLPPLISLRLIFRRLLQIRHAMPAAYDAAMPQSRAAIVADYCCHFDAAARYHRAFLCHYAAICMLEVITAAAFAAADISLFAAAMSCYYADAAFARLRH